MRVVIVVSGEPERDAVLTAVAEIGLPRLARLVPYAATRVVDSGAGTLVVVPAGAPTVAAGACAAGIAVNRTTPDLVLAVDVTAEGPVRLPATGPDGAALDAGFLAVAAGRLPSAVTGGTVEAPIASGAYAAAQVHGRRFLALSAPAGGVTAAIAALLTRDLRDVPGTTDPTRDALDLRPQASRSSATARSTAATLPPVDLSG